MLKILFVVFLHFINIPWMALSGWYCWARPQSQKIWLCHARPNPHYDNFYPPPMVEVRKELEPITDSASGCVSVFSSVPGAAYSLFGTLEKGLMEKRKRSVWPGSDFTGYVCFKVPSFAINKSQPNWFKVYSLIRRALNFSPHIQSIPNPKFLWTF